MKWIKKGFEEFAKGIFGNGGQNLYVSKNGILQRIFQYDLNKNGCVDLVFANCQNHHESAPSYVYKLTGEKDLLPGQGSYSGMVLDIDGDGYSDIVVAGYYDMAAPFASTDIYFGSEEGYSENRHIRIPTPWTVDCCHGDFNGKGEPMLAFASTQYNTVRIFEKTKLGCYEWNKYIDLKFDFKPRLIEAADLDGDGIDELIIRPEDTTETIVYWGGADGISLDNKTVLPEIPLDEMEELTEMETMESDAESILKGVRMLKKICWNGRECFTLSTGKKMYLFSANKSRQLEVVLDIEVPLAMSMAVGDIDGDGFDDIAISTLSPHPTACDMQQSFIIWNGPDGLDKRARTIIETNTACDVDVLDGHILFCQGAIVKNRKYTNNSKLFTYPDFVNCKEFEGEDARRGFLIKTPDSEIRAVLINHYARSSVGVQETFIYWGKDGNYSPDNVTKVPSHCAVDALILDFNDDGWPELIVANNSENALHLDVGHHVHYFGSNGFEPEKSHNIVTNIGWGVCAGDFDHDGYLEIATSGARWKEMRIYSARDSFSTYKTVKLPETCSVRWPAAVDLNMDGWLDLILPCSSHNTIILWGGPEGYSMERSTELATYLPIGVSAADLTKNGYPDLIVGGHTATGRIKSDEPHHSFVYIYWNGPEGISENRKCVLRGDAADHFAVADFNGDGWLDIFAGSYHGGKDRDINSFLYWNREGKFRELDRDLLYTHSASGCIAADLNEDGYIDLVVANHKVDGDHKGYSSIWWNGEKGFNHERCTHLPTNGPHGMITTEIGNIMDRSDSEYYYSEVYELPEGAAVKKASWVAENEKKTWVKMQLRCGETPEAVQAASWSQPVDCGMDIEKFKLCGYIQYRLELFAKNGCGTPRVSEVTIDFE